MNLLQRCMTRLILSLPLISSVYALICIIGSSQGFISKCIQGYWFFWGFLLAETAVEFPQLFIPSYVQDPDESNDKQGLRFLRHLSNSVGFGMTNAYHLFVFAFAATWPSYFTNLPVVIISTSLSRLLPSQGTKLDVVVNRMNQLFTCAFMLYVCGSLGNVFGGIGAVLMLSCFLLAKKPNVDMNPDDVYWFLVAVYCSVFVHSIALYRLMESIDSQNQILVTPGGFTNATTTTLT